MRKLSRKAVVMAASTAVCVLALGGVSSARAASAGTHQTSTTSTWQWAPMNVSGTVASVGTDSFTMTESGGTTVTIDVTTTTAYAETGAVTAPTGVTVGEQVTVTPIAGTLAHAATITAAKVLVVLTHVIGTVASVGTDSFTIQLQGGLILTVNTTASTAFRENGTKQAGVTVGQYVTAYGAPTAADPAQIDAQFVVISTPPVPAAPAPGPGGTYATGQLISGTASAVDPTSFVLTESDGTVLTIDTSTTTYGETGSPTAPTGVVSGDQVRVTPATGTLLTATTMTAARVVIVLTQVTGTVQSVSLGSFAVQLFGGLVVTVGTTSTTVYTLDGNAATGVLVGQKVTAYGAGDGAKASQLDAQFVDAHTQPSTPSNPSDDADDDDTTAPKVDDEHAASSHEGDGDHHGTDGAGDGHGSWTGSADEGQAHAFLSGTVSTVTGSNVVVTEASGATATMVVTATTKYVGMPGADTVAAIVPGVTVKAVGTNDSSGDLVALFVVIGTTPPAPEAAGAPAVSDSHSHGEQGWNSATSPGPSATVTTNPTWSGGSDSRHSPDQAGSAANAPVATSSPAPPVTVPAGPGPGPAPDAGAQGSNGQGSQSQWGGSSSGSGRSRGSSH